MIWAKITSRLNIFTVVFIILAETSNDVLGEAQQPLRIVFPFAVRPPARHHYQGPPTRHSPADTSIQTEVNNPFIHHIQSGYHHEVRIYPGKDGQYPTRIIAHPPLSHPSSSKAPYQPLYPYFGSIFVPAGATNIQPAHPGQTGYPGVPGTQPEIPGIVDPEQTRQGQFFATQSVSLRENRCRFFNDEGVCRPASECLQNNGRATAYCKDFSKFCCIFNLNCGSTTEEEAVYFRNERYPLKDTFSGTCGITVKKKEGMCYMRVTPTKLKLPASIGYCEDHSLSVTGIHGKNFEPLCGEMKDESYDVDVSSNAVKSINVRINANTKLKLGWKILISQIPCSETHGRLWPEAGTVSSGTKPEEETPKIKPQVTPEVPDSGSSKDVCGISPVTRYSPEANVANRRQLLSSWRKEEPEESEEPEKTEESKAVERYTHQFPNPLLRTLEWSVPTVNESILYEYAGPPLLVGTRITYGKKTRPHQYPWNVAMYSDGRFHCGASLLSSTKVLTAAHCVIRFKKRPQRLSLSIGDWDINSHADGKSHTGRVSKIVTHPGYSTATLKNDVAVLTLSKPIQLSETVKPVCLPDRDLNLDNKLVTVTGWGRDEKNKLQSVLMEHSASVVSNKECNKRWKAKGAPTGIIADTMLCMDPQDGDSCKGDSGGPVVVEDPSGSKRFIQCGIVSFGSASCTDKKLPGVYTKVSKLASWIKSQVQ